MIQKISEVQSQLQESLTGIRWVAQENLHFTLKFLASVEDKKVAPIMQALEEALRPVQCFSLGGKGIGVSKHDADLHPDLVNEDHQRVGTSNVGRQFTQGL